MPLTVAQSNDQPPQLNHTQQSPKHDLSRAQYRLLRDQIDLGDVYKPQQHTAAPFSKKHGKIQLTPRPMIAMKPPTVILL